MSGLDDMSATVSSPEKFTFSMTAAEFVPGTPYIKCNLPSTASHTSSSSSSSSPRSPQTPSHMSVDTPDLSEMPKMVSKNVNACTSTDHAHQVEDESNLFMAATTAQGYNSRAKFKLPTASVHEVPADSQTEEMDWESTNVTDEASPFEASVVQADGEFTTMPVSEPQATESSANKPLSLVEYKRQWSIFKNYRSIHHFNFMGRGVPFKTSTPPGVSTAVALTVPSIRHVDDVNFLREHTILGQAMMTIDPILYYGSIMSIKNLSGQQLRNEVTGLVAPYYTQYGWWHDDVCHEDEQWPVLDGDNLSRSLQSCIPIDGWSGSHGLPTRSDFYAPAQEALKSHMKHASDRYLDKRADGVPRSSLRHCQSVNGEASFPAHRGNFMLAAPAPRPRVRYRGKGETFSSGQYPDTRVIRLIDSTSKEVRGPLISKPGKMAEHILLDQVPDLSVRPLLPAFVSPQEAPEETPQQTPQETPQQASKEAPKYSLTPLPNLEKIFGRGLWSDHDEDEEVAPPPEATLPVVTAPQEETAAPSRAKLIPKGRLGLDGSAMLLYDAPAPQPIVSQHISSALVKHRDGMVAQQLESFSALEPATDAELEAEMAEDYAEIDDYDPTAVEPLRITNGDGDATSDSDSEGSVGWLNAIDTTSGPSIPGTALVAATPASDKDAAVSCIPGLTLVTASPVLDKETKKLAYCNTWAGDVESYDQEQFDVERHKSQPSSDSPGLPSPATEGSSNMATVQNAPELLANAPFCPEIDNQVGSSAATSSGGQAESSEASTPTEAVQSAPSAEAIQPSTPAEAGQTSPPAYALQASPPVPQETALSTQPDGTLVANPMDKYAKCLDINEAINPRRNLSNVWRMHRAMNRQRIADMEQLSEIDPPAQVPAIEAPPQVPAIEAPAGTDDVPDVEDDGLHSLFEYGPDEDPDACWRGLITAPKYALISNAPHWPEEEYQYRVTISAAQQKEQNCSRAAAERLARFREPSPVNDTSSSSIDSTSEPKTPDSVENGSPVERVPTMSQHSPSTSALLQKHQEANLIDADATSHELVVPDRGLRKSALKGFRQVDKFLVPPDESVSDADSSQSSPEQVPQEQNMVRLSRARSMPTLASHVLSSGSHSSTDQPSSNPITSDGKALPVVVQQEVIKSTPLLSEKHSPHQLEAIAEADEGPDTPSTLRDAGDHFEPSPAKSDAAGIEEVVDNDALRTPGKGSWMKGLTRSERLTNLTSHAPASSPMSAPATPAQHITESPYKRPASNTPNAMLSAHTRVTYLETIPQSPGSSEDVPAPMIGIGTIFEDDEAFDEDLAQDESFMSDLSVANDFEAEFHRQPQTDIQLFVVLPEIGHNVDSRQLYNNSDISTETAPSTDPAVSETNTGLTTPLEVESVRENFPASLVEALPVVKSNVLTEPQWEPRTSIDNLPNSLPEPTAGVHNHVDLKKRKSLWRKVENKLQKKQPESGPKSKERKGAGLKKALKNVKSAFVHTLNGFGLASEHGAML